MLYNNKLLQNTDQTMGTIYFNSIEFNHCSFRYLIENVVGAFFMKIIDLGNIQRLIERTI